MLSPHGTVRTQEQKAIKYLNKIGHPVGLLVTFQQLVLNLLNLDKPTAKLFHG